MRVGDREHHAPAALADAHDLLGAEVHLAPPQRDALALPQSAGPDEGEERPVVVAHRVIECRRLVVL